MSRYRYSRKTNTTTDVLETIVVLLIIAMVLASAGWVISTAIVLGVDIGALL